MEMLSKLLALTMCIMLFLACNSDSMTYTDEIYSTSDNGTDVRIVYPVFIGQNHTDLNDLIKQKAFEGEYFQADESDEGSDIISFKESCEITYHDDKYLSIVFKGSFYSYHAAHSTHTLRTFNYDLEKKCVIKLSDIIEYDQSLADQVMSELKNQTSSEIYDFIVKTFPDGLGERIEQMHNNTLAYDDSFNLTADGVSLNFELPYVFGGYASVIIP